MGTHRGKLVVGYRVGLIAHEAIEREGRAVFVYLVKPKLLGHRVSAMLGAQTRRLPFSLDHV